MEPASIALLGGAAAIALAIAWGSVRPAHAAWTAAAAAFCAAVALAAAWRLDVEPISLPWIGLTGSRFALALDPLGAPLAIFAAALASAVLLYTAGYLPEHLREENKLPREQARFATLLLGFMTSMILLLLAQDLLVIFLALELTALFSYLLIQFDRHKAEARCAATTALIITVGSSLLYVAGALLIARDASSTVLADIEPHAPRLPAIAIALLAFGVIAKSAQFPLHFWLPRAMVAPTPVSAYLHSAALVAAGVFVLLRLSPLLEPAAHVKTALMIVGALSIATGGLLALTSDGLKRILAGSTIAQYGYATFLVGIGTDKAIAAGVFLLVAHGLCKCALFMTAGAITQLTGADKLSEARGALRLAPVLAATSGIAALGLAGAPLTIGYFKDELFFAAAIEHNALAATIAGVAAAMTVAYTGRFWLLLMFGGADRARPESRPLLVTPVAILAIAIITGGLWLAPLESTFTDAATAAAAHHAPVHLEYKLAAEPKILMAPAAWAAGLLLLAARRLWEAPLARALETTAPIIGPESMAIRLASAAEWMSDALHRLELRDLRDRLKGVIVPTVIMVVLGLLAQGAFPRRLDPVAAADLPVAAALALAGLAAVIAASARRHLGLVILLSFVGFSLVLAFALSGAPNVALVLAVVETALTILFLAFLWRVDARDPEAPTTRSRAHWRFPWVGLVSGALGALVAMVALRTPAESPIARSHIELAEHAHAKDVVTAVLADFRGFDTAGEVTVFAIAIMGAVAITWGRSPRQEGGADG